MNGVGILRLISNKRLSAEFEFSYRMGRGGGVLYAVDRGTPRERIETTRKGHAVLPLAFSEYSRGTDLSSVT